MSKTVIHIGDAAENLRTFADFFDGRSAVGHRVELTISESHDGPILTISPPESPPLNWLLADIRRLPDQADRETLVVAEIGDPLSRVVIQDVETRRIIMARCQNLYRRVPQRRRRRLLAWSTGAVASVALIIFGLVPLMADQLAEFLPPGGEKALGDATFEQIRTALSENDFLPVHVCEKPAGVAALDQMQARLAADVVLPYPLTVHVLDHDLVNAFALPGGRVVLFRGLLDAADNPDEIAGVFAHEIGHVVNRDPARGALRSAGSVGVLGLLFGDFAGGTVVLFLLNRLIEASYSQEAEALADTFAHDALTNTDIAPSALADMFERFREEGGEPTGILSHFMAHPELGDRIAAARAADQGLQAAIRPSLSPEQWSDLLSICE